MTTETLTARAALDDPFFRAVVLVDALLPNAVQPDRLGASSDGLQRGGGSFAPSTAALNAAQAFVRLPLSRWS